MTGIDDGRAKAAADILLRARHSRKLDALPESCRPRDEAEAYAVQDAVASRLGPILGWKVGAGAPDAVPNCAPLLSGTLLASPAVLDPSAFALRGIEAEIAFRLAHDLPPRAQAYGTDRVLAAIDGAFPAIEVCESRYRDHDSVDRFSKLADNNLNAALVLGPAWAGWPDLVVAAQPVQLTFDATVVVDRHGGNAAGDLTRLLVWLANHLGRRGYGLKRGDIVTTGSWTGLRPAGAAKRVTARFPGIGETTLAFGNGTTGR